MRATARIMPRLLLPALLVLLALMPCRPGAASDQNAPSANTEPDWSHGRLLVSNPEGENVYARGIFRIIYHTRGEHAVPERDDNHNGIPDFVEDLALQLVVARHIFLHLSGFTDPLQTARYAGVKFVDAYVYDLLALQRTYNGAAYQTPRPAHAPAAPGDLALRMDISRRIDVSRNATPAHEYFHCIQNGATRLANRWYFEGMAAWSQDALDTSAQAATNWQNVDHLLHDPEGMDVLAASAYQGNTLLWTPLAELCDREGGVLPKNDPLLQSVYSNGRPVLKDFRFRGAGIMREVLRRFAAIEHLPYELYSYRNWDRPQQTDPRNNAYMLEEVRAVVKEMCPARGAQP